MCLSSAIISSPSSLRFAVDNELISFPSKIIFPFVSLSKAFNTSTNCCWPFPSTPAIPRISRSRTFKLKSWRISFFSVVSAYTPETSRIFFLPSLERSYLIISKSLPIIKLANRSLVVSAISTVPKYSPRRIILQRFATAIISLSLWVINKIVFPSAWRFLRIAKNSLISAGVKTAVGSSKIKMFASLYNILRISTLCCIPTLISPTNALGSTSKPYFLDSSVIFSAALSKSIFPPFTSSIPKIIFSATVKFLISLKCWCTIPIPSLLACLGSLISTSVPFNLITPASWWYIPKRTDINVDFPAPFSPSKAWISLFFTWIVISLFA